MHTNGMIMVSAACIIIACHVTFAQAQVPPLSPCNVENTSNGCMSLFSTPDGPQCGFDTLNDACKDCTSDTLCVAAPPSDAPCILNVAMGVCQSRGYTCSDYPDLNRCMSPHGYDYLDHCAWDPLSASCMYCDEFDAAVCPPNRCVVDDDGFCESQNILCSSENTESDCNEYVEDYACYWDVASRLCLTCGLHQNETSCNSIATCQWNASVSYCKYSAATTAASSTSILAIALGAGLGGAGCIVGIVGLVLYCRQRRDNGKVHAEQTPMQTVRLSNLRLTMPAAFQQNNNQLALEAPALFQDGRVQRLKLLGRGANGSVYSCVLPDGSIIALKEVLLPPTVGDSAEVLEGVMKEVSIVSSLDHPNVVRFYGSALEPDEHRLTIFMELVPSGSMASMVRSMSSPMQEDVARVYARQITDALAYIHAKGVVHRDLKCDNLLLTEQGRVKLTDFGASKVVGMGTMATRGAQTMVGTPFFMAPEILLAGEDDATPGYGRRADIWSLGITILEMLECGSTPWPSFPSTGAAFMHIAAPDSLPIVPERLSAAAKDFVLQCCRRDPLARPTSEQLLAHEWIALADEGITF